MIAFDKSPETNWSLGWHQDRTIAVRERQLIDGFGPWSTKDEIVHVEPPFELLERMVTLRLHLDQVTVENGALMIAPRSHFRGKISENQIEKIVAELPSYACYAEAGDVWLYKTPILHASGRSSGTTRRRVLHLDLSKDRLPKPLEWRGIL